MTSSQKSVVRLTAAVFTGCLLVSVAVSENPDDHENKFVPLFNGMTLEGFEGNETIWSARDGTIVGKSPGITHNDFLATTKQFRDFELRTEFRLVNGIGNSGIQFRSERVPGSTEVSGYQADLGQMFWGSLYDESRRRRILNCPNAEATTKAIRELYGPNLKMEIEDRTPSPDREQFQASLDKSGWNTYSIRAIGNTIVLRINGFITARYTEKEPQYVKAGILAFQVHSGPPCEVQFRKVRILEIAASREGKN